MNFTNSISLIVRDRHVRWMLAAAVAMVLLSFIRASAAGSVMVDDHGLTGAMMYLVAGGFFVALGIFSVSYYRLWREGHFDIAAIQVLAVLLAFTFSFMLPMLSNDVFSLLTYGDAANKGSNVYLDNSALHLSPYFKYVNPLWASGTCIYGPVTLALLRFATMIGGDNILLSLAVFKVVIFLLSLVFIRMVYLTSVLLHSSARPFLFIVLNPVFLLQGVGQLHCDGIAMAFTGAMLYYILDKKWYLSFLFAGIAIAAKLNFVLILPFLVVLLFINKKDWGSFLIQSVSGIAIALLVVAACYAPYYSSINDVLSPVKGLLDQGPAKSVAEILGDIIYAIRTLLPGTHSDMQSTIHATSGAPDAQFAAWMLAKEICQAFALLLSAYIFFTFWSGKRGTGGWTRAFLRLMLIFLLFFSHVYYVWYLMIALPFALYDDDLRFMQWLFVLTCFSNTHDITCTISRTMPVFFILLPVLTVSRVAIFFWRFRNNFFVSLKDGSTGQN